MFVWLLFFFPFSIIHYRSELQLIIQQTNAIVTLESGMAIICCSNSVFLVDYVYVSAIIHQFLQYQSAC